jgi:hypothetical protein
MFIIVGKDGTVALREGDDFKRLHIEAADGDVSPETVRRALAPHATFEDNSFWLDVEWLKALSGRAGDAAWEGSFAVMIASVRKFGWLSADGRSVRCHLKTN